MKISTQFSILAIFILLIFNCGFTSANIFLVFDHTEPTIIAKRYRPEVELRASASGQFSVLELQNILNEIPVAAHNIWIVDLRLESHGFINGFPVSWVIDRNGVNIGKTPYQISKEEQVLINSIRLQKNVIVFEQLKFDDGSIAAQNPSFLKPDDVYTEKEIVESFYANYARFYVLDHNRPSDAEVDRFIYFVQEKVKQEDWIHFHCRGGGGRSSTFITMYDIMLNAKNTSFAEILRRQYLMGNVQLDVLPISRAKFWKRSLAKERFDFLLRFYSYATDTSGFGHCAWSEWQKMHSN